MKKLGYLILGFLLALPIGAVALQGVDLSSTNTGVTDDAWTAYSPAVTSVTGTITTLGTVTGRFKKIGKTVFVEMDIAITTNGTGAGHILATLPVTATSNNYMISGIEMNNTGKQLNGLIPGTGTGNASIGFYDNTYPGANGSRLIMTGLYEIP